MDIFEKCEKFVAADELRKTGLYPYFRVIESAQEPEIVVGGKKMIMIGSNNYLGLANHPKVKEAAIRAIKKYGTGCAGSRFLNGNLGLHEELEVKLADFFKKEAALVFSTGFQTNLGTLSALITKDDVGFIDRYDHASVIDGCRLSFGEIKKFRHNNLNDLERMMKGCDNRSKLIIVDGVFSMEGDIAPLPELVKLANQYKAGLMVDDAHGIGVLGKTGRGTAEHFALEQEVDLVMGTYSKSLASIGGFIAGRKIVIDYIKHHARALIFSASLPPASVASVSTALDIINDEPERREKLWKNTRKMLDGFKSMGYDVGMSETPIIPIIIGENEKVFQTWKLLHEAGIFANAVVSPAVPQGRALIRTSFMATHTAEQLDRVLETFEDIGRKLYLI
jgi:8-amino-7-oxononanoate synthase